MEIYSNNSKLFIKKDGLYKRLNNLRCSFDIEKNIFDIQLFYNFDKSELDLNSEYKIEITKVLPYNTKSIETFEYITLKKINENYYSGIYKISSVKHIKNKDEIFFIKSNNDTLEFYNDGLFRLDFEIKPILFENEKLFGWISINFYNDGYKLDILKIHSAEYSICEGSITQDYEKIVDLIIKVELLKGYKYKFLIRGILEKGIIYSEDKEIYFQVKEFTVPLDRYQFYLDGKNAKKENIISRFSKDFDLNDFEKPFIKCIGRDVYLIFKVKRKI